MQARAFEGRFTNAPIDAAIAFRHIMTAMARPGTIETVTGTSPPAPLSVAAGCLILCLCDCDTKVFLAPSHDALDVRDWISFHTGAPFADANDAHFAIGRWDTLPLPAFSIGTPEYPDRSTTLVVESASKSHEGAVLTGPGIESNTVLSLPEIRAFQRNAGLFPLGLDFFFTSGAHLAALPRTTKVS
ncbi:MAG: phosphonate C-P lyase system protein PhnH [Roseobacter sp.]